MNSDQLAALQTLSSALAHVEQNSDAWTYTITGRDGSPYLTRTLLPRIAGQRMLLHHIHRPDADRWLHNHPWATATFRILSGGYTEERLVDGEVKTFTLRPGDMNTLDASTFHRVVAIEPDTWTLGIVGERVQEWGFLVDGVLIPSAKYTQESGAGQS